MGRATACGPAFRVLLACLALTQVAAECDGQGNAPAVKLRLLPQDVTVVAGQAFVIDVVAETNTSLQAYDFTVSFDDGLVQPIWYAPTAEFDDDGGFFKYSAAGPVVQLVDVRHGAASSTGNLSVATLAFQSLGSGTLSISLDGEAADGLGVSVPTQVTAQAVTQVTITP